MQNFLQKMLCRLPRLRSYLKQWKKCQNMKKITLFIMDVGVLDQSSVSVHILHLAPQLQSYCTTGGSLIRMSSRAPRAPGSYLYLLLKIVSLTVVCHTIDKLTNNSGASSSSYRHSMRTKSCYGAILAMAVAFFFFFFLSSFPGQPSQLAFLQQQCTNQQKWRTYLHQVLFKKRRALQ